MGIKPKRERVIQGRKRQCLKCGKPFKSSGNSNRMCTVCRDDNFLIETGRKRDTYYGR